MAGPRRKPAPAGKKPAPVATAAPAVVAPVADTATPPPAAPPPSGQDTSGTPGGETATIAGLLPAPATSTTDASSTTSDATTIVVAAAPAAGEPSPAPATAPGNAGAVIVTDGASVTPPVAEAVIAPPADVEARVLVAFGDLDVNAIATASPAEIERLANAGMVDPHPDAVAAARELIA